MSHSGFGSVDYSPAAVMVDLALQPVIGTIFSASLDQQSIPGGVLLTYTITNISGAAQGWPMINLPMGWDDTGEEDEPTPLTRLWAAGYHWKNDGQWNHSAPWENQIDLGYGHGIIQAACCALDDAPEGSEGTTTLGWATDYPYAFWLKLFWWMPGKMSFQVRGDVNARRLTREMVFRPGETKTIRFWLKAVSGTGVEQSLDAVQPYTDWMKVAYPYNPPELPRGRLQGMHLAQHEASTNYPNWDGTKQWWKWGGSAPHLPGYGERTPEQFSGWFELLDAIVNDFGGLELFRARGYVAMMFWAASGYHSGAPNMYFPSVVRNLPANLLNTLNEVPRWMASRGISIGLWMGYGFSAYQAGGWDSPSLFPQLHGQYNGVYPGGTLSTVEHVAGLWSNPVNTVGLGDIMPSSIHPDARAEFIANIHEALKYFGGCGFDACAVPQFDPWILDELRLLRRKFPTKWFCHEAQGTDKIQSVAPQWFTGGGIPPSFPGIGPRGYDGIRCPLMERMYPGWRAFVTCYATNQSLIPGYFETTEQGDLVPVSMDFPNEPASQFPTRGIEVSDRRGAAIPWGGGHYNLGKFPRRATTNYRLPVAATGSAATINSVTISGDASIVQAPTATGQDLVLALTTTGTEKRATVIITHNQAGSPHVVHLRWDGSAREDDRDAISAAGSTGVMIHGGV